MKILTQIIQKKWQEIKKKKILKISNVILFLDQLKVILLEHVS